MPLNSDHSNPPLLQTYTFPSGPTAAPFGPPPVVATRVTSPPGLTRANVPLWISTTTTAPSSMAIGPSGKRSPSHTKRRSATTAPRVRGRGTVSSAVLMHLRSSRPELLELELLETTVTARPRRG